MLINIFSLSIEIKFRKDRRLLQPSILDEVREHNINRYLTEAQSYRF